MSQQPSRGGPSSYQGPTPWTPSGQQNAPSPFRPVSAPSPSPQQQLQHHQQSRGPPIQQKNLPHYRDPMSPIPTGIPLSPGTPSAFGVPQQQGGSIQCPMPRWLSPSPANNSMPRPYIPVPTNQPSRAGGNRSGSDKDEIDSGPSTAEIIASQSQDYVDEELAKYQATIHQLQGE
ncbi:hypothetical protein QAD02_004807 [Eretmocerus hayati]|uniref:Uncharacterized protein n=1 Tax=Eretmocerus hayati TaxID=131215 RepID=A0ACC2NVE9_9HYME|nr:hypothetical protein QAD02_004807 [Eretmocerus hayati]